MSSVQSVLIRAARDDDSAGICALIAAVFAEYPGCVFDISEMPDLVRPRSTYEQWGGSIWVAESDGQIVGTVAVVPSQNNKLELKNLYVSAHARGTGIGRRLISILEERARALHKDGVHLWSDTRFERAHAVYEHCGYARLPGTRELQDLSKSVEYPFEKRFTD